MNSLETEGRTLVDHSWDFEKADTKYSNHGFHSYPAMMIPQVAIIEDSIVAHGRDAKKVYSAAKEKFPRKTIFLAQVPRKEAMIL